MTETREIARRYHDAWTAGDAPTVAALLAPDFRFAAGERRVAGRDAFLDSGAFPADAKTAMVAEAYDGPIAFQMYDSRRGGQTVRIVEQLTIRDGLIASSELVTDAAAFARFVAP
jgi:ketosteroid isomerase-like protein